MWVSWSVPSSDWMRGSHLVRSVSPGSSRVRWPLLAGLVLAAALPGSFLAEPVLAAPSTTTTAAATPAAKTPAVVPGPTPAVVNGARGATPTAAAVSGKALESCFA